MKLFDMFKKKKPPLFVYDDGNDVYTAEINGIIFQCEKMQERYEKFAIDLANAYPNKLNNIIEFILPDIKMMFEVDDVDIIKKSLGTPLIDLDREILSYLGHTFDAIHIIDVEFDGIFDRFLYSSIDG